jgi:hypothetical protein
LIPQPMCIRLKFHASFPGQIAKGRRDNLYQYKRKG